MSQQDVSDETIERFRQLPVATIYGGVRALGHEPCFMERRPVVHAGAKARRPGEDPPLPPAEGGHREGDAPRRGLARVPRDGLVRAQ